MRRLRLIPHPWRDPLSVLGAFADEPFALALVSGPHGWSYLARDPDRTVVLRPDDPRDPFETIRSLLGPGIPATGEGPPFSGGVAGLAAYGLARRIEAVDLGAYEDWPDLAIARYSSVLAFDPSRGEVLACGRGEDEETATAAAKVAGAWLDATGAAPAVGRLAAGIEADDPGIFEDRVEQVRARIAAGDLFQANIARRWRGRLEGGIRPYDLFARLCRLSPAPMAAYLGLGDRALVSNSPERFVQIRRRRVETRPIKGTAPRGADLAGDRLQADALLASAKDRAENLMIVDLMRNDISRVCEPGTVEAPELCRLETFANVHHLVSTVTGRLRDGADAAELLRAVLPPGSITGAPKVQAMKLIAQLEPPRGPFFGSVFYAGADGDFDSSVLIRTVALAREGDGWRFEARAGGGLVADSDPAAERRETEDKISAILRALTEANP